MNKLKNIIIVLLLLVTSIGMSNAAYRDTLSPMSQVQYDYFQSFSNNSSLITHDFNLAVSKGLIPGHSVVDKFGENPEITIGTDPEDIWEFGGVYTFTANTGVTYYMSSSNNADTQTIEFQVLTVDSNDNWNLEIFDQDLVGQTKTALTPPSGDPIVRIFRMQNEDNFNLAGTMYVYEDDTTTTPGIPDTATKVRAIIDNGNNQTLMALYTIPSGFVGYLYRGEIGLAFSAGPNATDFAKADYRSRRFGGVFKTKKRLTNITTGQPNYLDKRSFPDPIPAKTDIVLRVEEVSATMGVWGTLDILLIDENLLSDEYLTAIGQIKRVE